MPSPPEVTVIFSRFWASAQRSANPKPSAASAAVAITNRLRSISRPSLRIIMSVRLAHVVGARRRRASASVPRGAGGFPDGGDAEQPTGVGGRGHGAPPYAGGVDPLLDHLRVRLGKLARTQIDIVLHPGADMTAGGERMHLEGEVHLVILGLGAERPF